MNELRDDRLRGDLAELADTAQPVDLYDRVLVASSRARTRTIVSAALALVLLVGGGVAAVVLRGPHGNALPPAGPTTPAVLPERALASYDPTISHYDAGPLAHATLTVPPWPGQAQCPSGSLTFIKDGLANDESQATVHIIAVTPADVDGDGGTDQVAILECYPQTGPTEDLFHYQVLAFTNLNGPGGIRTLGRVTSTGIDGIVGVFGLEVGSDGTVRVKVGDRVGSMAIVAQLQWREYRWQGAQFVQTAGDHSFPADPATVDLVVAATTAVTTVDGQRYVTVTVTTTSTGSLAPAVAPVVTLFVPDALEPVDPARWAGCWQNRENIAEHQVGLQCPLPTALGPVAFTFRQEGALGNVTTIYLNVDQGTPRLLERNLNDNFGEFPVP